MAATLPRGHSLLPRIHPEARKDLAYVPLRAFQAQSELLSDLAVRCSAGHQAKHILLTCRQGDAHRGVRGGSLVPHGATVALRCSVGPTLFTQFAFVVNRPMPGCYRSTWGGVTVVNPFAEPLNPLLAALFSSRT